MTAALDIAVVVSVRNGERFLAKALESIAAQTRPPAEVVVVDGRSEDRTRAIAATFPFVRVIDREPCGVGDANNAGIAATTSPLIAFLSHDDCWWSGKLAAQAARLEADAELDFVVGRAAFSWCRDALRRQDFELELLAQPTVAFIMETLLARRELFARVGPFDTSLRSAEDVDWFSRAFDLGIRSEVLADVVVHKCIHDRNTSLDAAANTARLLRVVRAAAARKQAIRGGA